MHIHILGICGTFMGSLAMIAKAAGHKVTGCDTNVYPPMSELLQAQSIDIIQGYDADQLKLKPDLVVVGNALTRGNPMIEAVLNQQIPYTSGPQWLSDEILQNRWVLSVSGTHGKTTTTSILTWILDYAKLNPGFLIGGAPANFSCSARLGDAPYFVIEADEYDTAFFDKRSKFVHYRPRTAILNNLEFDHADIFPNIQAIQRQFHHLVRTLPSEGAIIVNGEDDTLAEAMNLGCWTPTTSFGRNPERCDWTVELLNNDGTHFRVKHGDKTIGDVEWELPGDFNAKNALAALLAAQHAGVDTHTALDAISEFKGIRRRQERIGEANGVLILDDFAHHPSAIELTLKSIRASHPNGRRLAIIEPRSATMRMGVHSENLGRSTHRATHVIWVEPDNLPWSLTDTLKNHEQGAPYTVVSTVETAVESAKNWAQPGDTIVTMSNGGFGGIQYKLLNAIERAD